MSNKSNNRVTVNIFFVNFRYPTYVYQVDLSCQVAISVILASFAFVVIKWEKLVKENPWIVYTISLSSIGIIEVIIKRKDSFSHQKFANR